MFTDDPTKKSGSFRGWISAEGRKTLATRPKWSLLVRRRTERMLHCRVSAGWESEWVSAAAAAAAAAVGPTGDCSGGSTTETETERAKGGAGARLAPFDRRRRPTAGADRRGTTAVSVGVGGNRRAGIGEEGYAGLHPSAAEPAGNEERKKERKKEHFPHRRRRRRNTSVRSFVRTYIRRRRIEAGGGGFSTPRSSRSLGSRLESVGLRCVSEWVSECVMYMLYVMMMCKRKIDTPMKWLSNSLGRPGFNVITNKRIKSRWGRFFAQFSGDLIKYDGDRFVPLFFARPLIQSFARLLEEGGRSRRLESEVSFVIGTTKGNALNRPTDWLTD